MPVSKLKSKKKKKRAKVRDHAILGFVGKIAFNTRRPIRTLIISLLSRVPICSCSHHYSLSLTSSSSSNKIIRDVMSSVENAVLFLPFHFDGRLSDVPAPSVPATTFPVQNF